MGEGVCVCVAWRRPPSTPPRPHLAPTPPLHTAGPPPGCRSGSTSPPRLHVFNDGLMGELGREVENGRLLRLLIKLGYINERPGTDMTPGPERAPQALSWVDTTGGGQLQQGAWGERATPPRRSRRRGPAGRPRGGGPARPALNPELGTVGEPPPGGPEAGGRHGRRGRLAPARRVADDGSADS